MSEFIYVCSAIVSLICTFLLARSYFKTQARLLLWVTLSFGFLALNNIFACVDLILFVDVDLMGSLVRNALGAVAGTILVFGLAWELT